MKIDSFLTKVKPGTLAIIVIVLGVGLYLLFKSSTASANQSAVDNITVDATKLTLSTENLDLLLSQIFTAMDVPYPTCDNDTILGCFNQLGSQADINYLIKNFGVKAHFLNGEATSFFTKLISTDLNLVGWISACCNSDTTLAIGAIFSKYGLQMS